MSRKTMRVASILGAGLLCWASSSFAWMNIQFSVPGVSIGFNAPAYPQFAPVPGYPVYYAPNMGANYFYYDGMYWLYQNDNWYAASWYNGPWGMVSPMEVPGMLLQIPVGYYRFPPPYFRGWARDEAPHWGDHWGHEWRQRRQGWDAGHGGHPGGRPAPLPDYQRQYQGAHYPHDMQQQNQLHQQNFHYQPHEPMVQQQYHQMGGQRGGHPGGEHPQRGNDGNHDHHGDHQDH